MAPVNSCVFRSTRQHLISAGTDKRILYWVPKMDQNRDYKEEVGLKGVNIDSLLQDEPWTSDEDD